MWRYKAREAAPHAGCVSGTNGSGYGGGRPRTIYRWVWAGRTACVAGRPLETMLSRWVAGPSEGISNQLRSAGAALQRLPTIAKGVRTRPIGRIADVSKDTWSTEIERRTTQKVMSQDLHKVSAREAFTASSAFWAAASNNRLYRSIVRPRSGSLSRDLDRLDRGLPKRLCCSSELRLRSKKPNFQLHIPPHIARRHQLATCKVLGNQAPRKPRNTPSFNRHGPQDRSQVRRENGLCLQLSKLAIDSLVKDVAQSRFRAVNKQRRGLRALVQALSSTRRRAGFCWRGGVACPSCSAP